MLSISSPTIIPPPPPLPLPPPPPPPSSLLPLLEQFNTLPHVRQIHARALKSLTSCNSTTHQHQLHFLYSRLIHHSSRSSPAYASLLLRHPLHPSLPPNAFCFNTLIRAAAPSLPLSLSFSLYLHMLLARVSPDSHTFPFLLKPCSRAFALPEGSQLHAHILKLGFSSDAYVSNSLIHFYSSCARLPHARRVFLRMQHRTPVSWNAIVDAHCVNGEYEAALGLFRDMMVAGRCRPDAYSLQSLLCACAGLGSLSLGTWAHAYMLRHCGADVVDDVLINNSLVDLYSKCGAVSMARQVFRRMPAKDVASHNAMLLGCAANGRVEEALDVFARMRSGEEGERLEPNSITFVGVLTACRNGGLVGDGRRYFRAMADDFGIEPRLEHYGCMVDMLARAGLIEEALGLVDGMRCKPDAVIWRSVLDACCKHNAGVRLGESVAKLALESEEEEAAATSGAYVLLSKIYASANRWNDVGLIRGLMSDNGVRKEPGCSSVEIDGVVHEFVAGDTTHPRSTDIYEKLNEIERRLALVGYKPDSSQAHLVAEVEGVKSDSLRLHSERLAIAFGLLSSTAKGTAPLRILKNLRVCRDCHNMTKLISSVYRVEIIVRDRTRFHHFRDGSCSCSDYW